MGLRLPSVPYRTPKTGYWDPVTSTLNWCEEDYYATIYSAEIVNTLTNLLFMGLAYRGCRNCWKYGHDRIFFVAFVGCFLVATGSFLFHSTLKYPMQLVDELSMIYTTCLMWYATFSHGKPRGYRIGLGVGLVALAIFITLYYHYLQDPSFHQTAYALLTCVVVFRSMFLMERHLRASWGQGSLHSQNREHEKSSRVLSKIREEAEDRRDASILRTMWFMISYGLSLFLGGFVIWTLDIKYCSNLRSWRRQIGLPWGILLEGHGWWHFMTGLGAYYYIVWGIWLRHCLNHREDEFKLEWPSAFFSLPQVVRADHVPMNGQAHGSSNGTAKKTR
ncbi:MAG: hypothetical protein M1823_005015 [Watsoniomyces obsoletus]|nr:MAG: hypothetical protein M1823_005015 [Watsoniomyces obsoletus]